MQNKPHSTNIELPETTIDAFFRGKFYLIQPKGTGHRTGLDAMLLAACVPSNFSGHIADFGSGSGGAGLAALSRSPQARLSLVENSLIMAHLADATLKINENKDLAKRTTLIRADIESPGKIRAQNKLYDNTFDFVIMNPPYNDVKTQHSKDVLRAKAHVNDGNKFEKWIRTAASCSKTKARIAIISRATSINEVLNALNKRYGNITIYPIHPKSGSPANRVIFIAEKNSKAPINLAEPIYIRLENAKGELELSKYVDAISNGENFINNHDRRKTR